VVYLAILGWAFFGAALIVCADIRTEAGQFREMFESVDERNEELRKEIERQKQELAAFIERKRV